MDKILSNKNILLFVPSFFGYEKMIFESTKKLGANPIIFEERPISGAFERGIAKIFPSLFDWKFAKRFKNIIDNVDAHIDYVVIVKCDCMSVKTIKYIRQKFADAKICLYLWDSIKNIKGIKKKIPYFDICSSFDDVDSKKYNLRFRPLFYNESNNKEECSIKYDLCFCGTVHSDRYFIINEISKQCKDESLTFFKYLFLSAKFLFYLYKIFLKGFRKAKKSEIAFNKMSPLELYLKENSSRIIIDIHHPKQIGLTMRTIQTAVLLNKKLITTNKNIVNYDFYSDKNIMVIDRKKPILDASFIKEAPIKIEQSIKIRYSIEQWLLDVLGVTNEDFSYWR